MTYVCFLPFLMKFFKNMSFCSYFCGGTLTTNRRPFAVSVVCPLGDVSQQPLVFARNFACDSDETADIFFKKLYKTNLYFNDFPKE